METPFGPLSLIARAVAERDRWALWIPVFLGIGIGLYFAWPVEPWGGTGLCAAAIAAGAAFLLRARPIFMLAAAAAALVGLGLAAAQLRAAWVQAPVLERPSGKISVVGTVIEVEPMADGGSRLTLNALEMDVDGPAPQKIRVRVKDEHSIPSGSRIRLNAVLMPPPQPSLPGAFDFARHAWFQGLGAVGTGLGRPEILIRAPNGRGMNGMRQWVMSRILAALPPALGGVAAALVTGETSAAQRPVIEAYRNSGLAHLLAISGLHMGLVAGFAFFVIRGGLALIPAVALRRPIKKWAAAGALALTLLYLLLAGAPIPAQRAFLMTGIVLIAVMLDRNALSMRLVAVAATCILLIAPESLIGPSFQMSFAAVAALIAAYEAAAKPLSAWRSDHRNLPARAALYVFGVAFSTLIAGSSTAVYGAFHFNRFAAWSVLANMAAVPLTGLVVMPTAMLSLLLMPFGLERLALIPMGWGIGAVNWTALQVSALPGASVLLPPLPVWALVLFTAGGLWAALWRGRWRLWGAPVMISALCAYGLWDPPDILADGRGYSFAVRGADGALLINRGGRILRDTWGRRAGPASPEKWPKHGRSDDGRLSCDDQLCLYRLDGIVAALVLDEQGIAAACASAQAVISAVPMRGACRGARMVTDRFDLWRRGAYAFWIKNGKYRFENIDDYQGNRPWSYKPKKRKKRSLNDDDERENDDS